MKNARHSWVCRATLLVSVAPEASAGVSVACWEPGSGPVNWAASGAKGRCQERGKLSPNRGKIMSQRGKWRRNRKMKDDGKVFKSLRVNKN